MISLQNLTVAYKDTPVPAVNNVSLTVETGERVGIVGESGSGKSTLAAAILRSLPKSAEVTGKISFKGQDLNQKTDSQFRSMRSVSLAYIPQDPLANLNPVLRIGNSLRDVIRAHRKVSRLECVNLIEDALAEVGIPEPHTKRKAFPHELSGGMRQRVLIAMALINAPELLIADEPTTALDVTVQAQILQLMQQELDGRDMSLLLITHDIGVVAELCSRIVVMRHGEIVEEGSLDELSKSPSHPYTEQLFDAAQMDFTSGEKAV